MNRLQAASKSTDLMPSTSLLLSLPAELRDAVYEFALYHQGGAIFPIAGAWKQKDNEIYVRNFRTSIDGHPSEVSFVRYEGSKGYRARRQDFGDRADATDLDDEDLIPAGVVDPCQVSAYSKRVGEAEDKKVPFTGHVCNPSCLVQPALTRVNRQVRQKALPVFYSCNKFFLESGNFALAEYHGGHCKDLLSLPTRRLRCIGDTNLRALRRIHITSHEKSQTTGKIASSSTTSDVVGVTASVKIGKYTYDANGNEQAILSDVSASSQLKDCLDQMRENGVFVCGIEQALRVGNLLSVKNVDWPEKDKAGDVFFEGWGGGHHAYVQ